MDKFTSSEVYQAGKREARAGRPAIPSYWEASSFHGADKVFLEGYWSVITEKAQKTMGHS